MSYVYSWKSVERGCWEYFNRVLGTIEGVTAFSLRSLPKTLPDENSFIWRFAINGGQKPVRRQRRSELINGAWLMDALFEAWGISDDVIMIVGGTIEENTPICADDGVPGLLRLDTVAYPSREPDTIRLGGEANAGQDILCVRLTIPMQVAFGNVSNEERTV